MKKGALVAKFTSCKLVEESAELGVPHGTAYGLAGEDGTGVDDMLFLAVRAKLTVTILVKFANIFQGCHFFFKFLKVSS